MSLPPPTPSPPPPSQLQPSDWSLAHFSRLTASLEAHSALIAHLLSARMINSKERVDTLKELERLNDKRDLFLQAEFAGGPLLPLRAAREALKGES